MTFTSSSNVNELSTPLLGERPQQESDEEQGCIPCPSLTLAIVYDDDDDEEESCQKAAEHEKQWTNILSVTSVVLLALFILQFGMAFFMSPVEEAAKGLLLKWSVVNYSIVLSLVVMLALYRQTVEDFKITCLVVTVAMATTFLGLVLCSQVVPTFLLLLSSMLCIGVFVAVSSIRFLVVIKSEASLLEEDHASVV
jgi:hypothetical protein